MCIRAGTYASPHTQAACACVCAHAGCVCVCMIVVGEACVPIAHRARSQSHPLQKVTAQPGHKLACPFAAGAVLSPHLSAVHRHCRDERGSVWLTRFPGGPMTFTSNHSTIQSYLWEFMGVCGSQGRATPIPIFTAPFYVCTAGGVPWRLTFVAHIGLRLPPPSIFTAPLYVCTAGGSGAVCVPQSVPQAGRVVG